MTYLLIAKLHSYGLSLSSPRLLSNYLSNRKQRIKIEKVVSKRENINICLWPVFSF